MPEPKPGEEGRLALREGGMHFFADVSSEGEGPALREGELPSFPVASGERRWPCGVIMRFRLGTRN